MPMTALDGIQTLPDVTGLHVQQTKVERLVGLESANRP